MSVHDLLQGLAERMGASADIKTIFGEPIAAEGKTIIPVARLAYGLGTGFGTRTTTDPTGNHEEQPAGQSGGGGIYVYPVGVVEVTPGRTRFVRARSPWTVRVGIFLAGLALGRRLPHRRSAFSAQRQA